MSRDFVLRTPVFRPTDEAGWRPSLDIYELRDGWLLKADLAGVSPEDVAITIHGSRITIRGVRRDLCIEERVAHYRMEIAYSRFERTVDLPCDPGPHDVRTEFRDGMLYIRLRCGGPS